MYCLDVIKSINNVSKAKAEDTFDRQCSFVEGPGGVVLHSALRRSTVFVDTSKPGESAFIARLKSSSPADLNSLIESRF